MANLNNGQKPSEFLSDHPVDSKRIQKLHGVFIVVKLKKNPIFAP
jgi:Zn-dependent protease with chaperone function